ncbi:hypothetical protein EDB92DRAFT_1033544 [Lactarius akahatsu]|uniref:Uncharacterized protein n=1 Tax=Lactarius akahatsu TaxID=416441 RepID=A0AAD4LE43_9AGAM|nr:hypothetical protein EDB92DRAFT_1033544 [Lactarius akahatsu]
MRHHMPIFTTPRNRAATGLRASSQHIIRGARVPGVPNLVYCPANMLEGSRQTTRKRVSHNDKPYDGGSRHRRFCDPCFRHAPDYRRPLQSSAANPGARRRTSARPPTHGDRSRTNETWGHNGGCGRIIAGLDMIGTAPTFDRIPVRKELAVTPPRSMDNRHLPATSRPPSLVKDCDLNIAWGFEFGIYPALSPGHHARLWETKQE